MKLVLGTKNQGKLKELFELAGPGSDLELELAPSQFDPEETGKSFIDNAIIKAKAAAELSHALSLGEDSGISVDALGGLPGIYSARYCQGSDLDRMHKMLEEMTEVPDGKRQGEYICAMALVSEAGAVLYVCERKWRGEIARSPAGENGFGYDPIFYLPELKKTSAELSRVEKNAISHRAQAWCDMIDFLKTHRASVAASSEA